MLVIIAIGRGKGVKAILGLAYTLYLVIFLLLPTVFSGYSPVLMSIICVALSTIVTLMLLNGASKKTYSAIVATVLGVVLSAGGFYLMSLVLKVNGFSVDEAESLVLINQATGLSIKDILFAGIFNFIIRGNYGCLECQLFLPYQNISSSAKLDSKTNF